MFFKRTLVFMTLWLCLIALSSAQVDAKMLRYPDVSDTQITFVYAGDIWVAPKKGGLAFRLSSPPGEEIFPRFSPDGKHIAFTGNYDGNMDIYVIPALGGETRRITFHPSADRMIDWRPDSQGILFASTRESGRTRFSKIFSIPTEGGFAEKLPIAYGEFGDLSKDGRLLAFTPQTRAGRTWKRYRGGGAPEIWIFNLDTKTAKNISSSEAVDDHPMWYGDKLYFLSDRGTSQRHNIWKYNSETGETTQITHLKDYDVTYPAIGPSEMVFEAGGRLYLMDLSTEKTREVEIDVVTDKTTLKPKRVKVDSLIENAGISPSGKRAFFAARGDIFSVPEEHGIVLDITRTSGTAERYPSWSPDGKHLAYWSDRTGEYELYLQPSDGASPARKLTNLGPGLRYTPYWSPDSKKLAYIDQTNTIFIFNIADKKITRVDRCVYLSHPALEAFQPGWSTDSAWIAYEKVVDNFHTAIFLYNLNSSRTQQVTSGYFNDSFPVFDPDGKYLFYLSDRSLMPVYGDTDGTWIYPNSTRIVAVPLRRDVASPLAARNDTEAPAENEAAKKPEAKPGKESPSDDSEAKPTDEKKTEALEIDLDGFEHRLVLLPPPPGNYSGLSALKGQVLYHQRPRTGSADRSSPIMAYDLEKRKPSPIVENANGFTIAAGGKKMLVSANRSFYIVDIRPGQKLQKKLRTQEMEALIDPRAEWKQMFSDIWRKYRDFFYDPDMHGVDWEGMRSRYGKLLNDAVTRWDANFVFGELIAELNSSHTYVGRGDLEQSRRDTFGMLGIDWALENGFEVKGLIRSPLHGPAGNVEFLVHLALASGQAATTVDEALGMCFPSPAPEAT